LARRLGGISIVPLQQKGVMWHHCNIEGEELIAVRIAGPHLRGGLGAMEALIR
jgi:hypothetical protein